MYWGPSHFQQQHSGLLQAEGRTCEDFQDEDQYLASPSSSGSPSDRDITITTTASSLLIDSLTTEGKVRAWRRAGPGESN